MGALGADIVEALVNMETWQTSAGMGIMGHFFLNVIEHTNKDINYCGTPLK
jgi:hypothetical protein